MNRLYEPSVKSAYYIQRNCLVGFTFITALLSAGCGSGYSVASRSSATPAILRADPGGPYISAVNSAVTFDGTKSSSENDVALTYAWDFGDSGIGTGSKPAHIYKVPGTYSVSLTAADSKGHTSKATTTAIVHTLVPTAKISGPCLGNAGSSIAFDGSQSAAPSGQTLAYSWDFGDGTTGVGATTAHVYSVPGNYTVKLTAVASGGGEATEVAAVVVYPLPTAVFGGPYKGVANTPLSFDGSKSTAPNGQALRYLWSFGDGSTALIASPSHTYVSAGTFTVSLNVTDDSGGTAIATGLITIAALPVANAGGPYSGTAGTAMTFDGSKSTVSDGQTLSYMWDFGDGSSGTGVMPKHTFANAGTYAVKLTATGSGGGTATATSEATVTRPLLASAGGPYASTAGVPIAFDASKSSGPAGQSLNYLWDFGDGTTGAGANATHTYASAGIYTATLMLTSSLGLTAKATAVASVVAGPTANAGGPYSGVTGAAIMFDGSKSTVSGGQTLSYVWEFGDGSSGIGATPKHAFASTGTYVVKLTVTGSGGGAATATSEAAVTMPLLANAGGPYANTAGVLIPFDASKSSGPAGQSLSYQWNFGDGTAGAGVNATHAYAAAGIYTVTLTLTSSLGLTATATALASVVAGPTANAGGPYSGTAGTAITFDGSKSTVSDGQTLSYMWDFGDGSSGTGVMPKHTFANAGTYAVKLIATVSGGGSATATATALVAAPLLADAGGPYANTTGVAITFDASRSSGPAGQALTYMWKFGDGGTSTGVNVTHMYAAAGTYKVTLTLTSGSGLTSTATTVASVVAGPTANAGGPYDVITGTTVNFDGARSTAPQGQSLTYSWNFGDGGTGTGVNPSHAYSASGKYAVVLTIVASGGTVATANTTANVTTLPAANAGGAYTGVVGTAVAFSGARTTTPLGQTLAYTWDFGDGGSATGVSPTHIYTTAGTFNVSLTVISSSGGIASSPATATISAMPMAADSVYLPMAGGTMTGPLSNSTLITAKQVGSVLQADQFDGVDPSIQINTCLKIAYMAGGGTCDARLFTGDQTMSQTIEILEKTTLLLPHSGYWCWGFTDGKSVGIQQDSNSQLIGPAAGGGGNNMLLRPCNASTNMLALYATQDNPLSGGQSIYATGFNAQNMSGATFTKGVVYTRYLSAGSLFERITAINNYGDAWHVYKVCCDVNFQEAQAASSYGASGGTPLVVEGQSSFGWSGTINSAGSGRPNIDIQAGNVALDFWNLYMESGDLSPGTSSPADISTPLVNIAGSPIVRFHGGFSSMSTTKPCFNNPALVSVNNSWCGNGALPVANAACPWNNTVYGTDSQYLYVCAGNRVRRRQL